MLAINIEKRDKIMHEAGCIARFRTVCADEYFMRDCLSFEFPKYSSKAMLEDMQGFRRYINLCCAK